MSFQVPAQYKTVRALSFFVGSTLRHFVPRQAPAAGARLPSVLICPSPKIKTEDLHITTINLKEFFYWYKADVFIEVNLTATARFYYETKCPRVEPSLMHRPDRGII